MTARPSRADLAAAQYRKSTYSGGGGNECVECASLGLWSAVRDSKAPGRGAVVLPEGALTAFLRHLKRAR
ncbi:MULTISPECIES: DUF397 domain-containing protein [Streptomyces]|uniref:DUF397 domain-containing protein n=1 Tax=Streptomyces TaxID=1883 RepID=UPI00099D89E8|nr:MULTISPECIES: DUF397 domain-containing protein [Streptomyces]